MLLTVYNLNLQAKCTSVVLGNVIGVELKENEFISSVVQVLFAAQSFLQLSHTAQCCALCAADLS